MKNKIKILALAIGAIALSNAAMAQTWSGSGSPTGDAYRTGNVGIGNSAPAAPLDVTGSASQLRLSNSASVYSDIQTNPFGYLLFNQSTGSFARVGFGTTSPLTGFHSNMGVFRISDPGSASRGFQVSPNYTSANGDIPAGTVVLTPITTSGEGLSFASSGSGAAGVKIGFYAFNGSTWKSMLETQNVSSGTPALLLTRNGGNVGIGTSSPRAKLDVNGKVIIGTTTQTGTHSNAMLTVDGKAVAKEIIVTVQNWADYVFSKEYQLPALHDVEKYYLANKHLPEIPSEQEVIENGISVGEMNKLLLKKIEELTIYVVEQQKEIEKLKAKIK